jgi:hypothetical protein
MNKETKENEKRRRRRRRGGGHPTGDLDHKHHPGKRRNENASTTTSRNGLSNEVMAGQKSAV